MLLGGTFWQVNNSLQSLAPELYTQAEDRPHKNEAAPEAAEAAFQGDLAAPMPMPVVKELLEEEKGNEKEVDKKETDQGKEKDDKQKFEQEKEKAIAMEKKAEEKEKEKEKEEKEKEKKNKDKEDEADEKKDEAEKKDKDIDTATAKPTATEKKEEQTTIIGGPYTKKPLNIMLFYPDDWRHDSIGGVAPIVKTPYLNQLATEGIRFTHNMVTTSICWISRATLFTGQYVSRHKSVSVRRTEFYNTWNTSWPGLLRSHGYYTGHIGKWQYLNPDRFVEKNLFNHTNLFEGSHYFRGKYAADKTRDDTIEFLRNRPKDRPFAMTAAFYPPKAVGMSHEPGAQWTPKPETRAKFYENETIPEPPYNVEESYQKMPWFFHVYEKEGRYRWNQRFNGTHKYQAAMKNYYSLVTEVDQACREIVDELKAQGLYEDTLIIFTADNGVRKHSCCFILFLFRFLFVKYDCQRMISH